MTSGSPFKRSRSWIARRKMTRPATRAPAAADIHTARTRPGCINLESPVLRRSHSRSHSTRPLPPCSAASSAAAASARRPPGPPPSPAHAWWRGRGRTARCRRAHSCRSRRRDANLGCEAGHQVALHPELGHPERMQDVLAPHLQQVGRAVDEVEGSGFDSSLVRILEDPGELLGGRPRSSGCWPSSSRCRPGPAPSRWPRRPSGAPESPSRGPPAASCRGSGRHRRGRCSRRRKLITATIRTEHTSAKM